MAERDLIAERIHVASPGTQVPPPPITTIAVQARLRALVDRLSIFVVLAEADEAMRPTLVEALAASALPVVVDQSTADFRLEASVRVSEQSVEGMIRADGSADVILVHVPSSRQVAATSIEDRAAANRSDLARERLLDRLA